MKKRIGVIILIVCMAFTLIPTFASNAAYTGMKYVNGEWRYVVNDIVDYNYTGMASNEHGWWYYQNGHLDWNYTGMACNEYGWWYYQNGHLDWNYTGMACNEYGWWYYQNGHLDWNYTGMAYNEYGWWYYQNGQLNWTYTGMALNENGWWYYQNGHIDFNYTGMACNEYGWWYFENGFLSPFTGVGENAYGKWYYENGTINWNFTGPFNDINRGWVYVCNGQVDEHYTGITTNEHGTWYFEDGRMITETGSDGNITTTYTGMALDESGKWVYLKHGKIDTDYTGMALNEYGWWYYKNGTVDFNYKGVARNTYGTWYFNKGQIDFNYEGTYKDGSVTYAVSGGRAVAQASRELLLGVFFNSREDSTDTLYVSFDGYTFISISEAFKNINNTVDGDDLADCSPSLVFGPSDGDWYNYYGAGAGSNAWNVYTQRDPSIFYKDGYFWMTGTARGSGENKQKFIPMLAYSRDLINWSYPCAGHSASINYNLQSNWLTPTQAPPATNAEGGYDAVAGDAFVDTDGTVWLVVSTGKYTDTHGNSLSPYLVKIANLSVPAGADISTPQGKCEYSDFNVEYGAMQAINLPLNVANQNKTWNHNDYDYDGSLYKKDGYYYYTVQHSGEIVQIWRIDNLDNVSNPNAWTLVNSDVVEGSEGPCVTEFNGKTIVYCDRYPGWTFYDIWGDGYGITASTAESLTNGGKEYPEATRITTIDKQGNVIPARHGSVIHLTDTDAINAVLAAYNSH